MFSLLKAVEVLEIKTQNDVEVKGIEYHSQNVTPGDLFVCIKGYKTDGHKYLAEAVKKGAVAAIVEEFQDLVGIPQVRVKNSRLAMARLSCKFFGYPTHGMKVIGITATNGKTTTAYMVERILESGGFRTGLIGTVVYKVNDHIEPSGLTTPESVDLQRIFARMIKENVSHAVMEVSSMALEMNRVDGVDYDIVTLNNVGREHIDHHGSFENYFNKKAELIRKAGAGARAVLNLDCPYARSLVDQTRAGVFTFGVESKEGFLSCRSLDLSSGRPAFSVEVQKPFCAAGKEYQPGMLLDLELTMPGYHSAYNSMMALSIGLLCGIPLPAIKEAIESFTGVERRFELIFEDDFKILDDHFANSNNINMTLETLQLMNSNNNWLVYALRGGRGVTVNRENAEAIAGWAPRLGIDEVIATLSCSHVEAKDRVAREELEIFQKVMSEAGIKVRLWEELPDAIYYTLSRVKPGDVVILAGAQGMDHGAGIALEQIKTWRPHLNNDRLFKPLEKRVAGIM